MKGENVAIKKGCFIFIRVMMILYVLRAVKELEKYSCKALAPFKLNCCIWLNR